MQAKTPKEWSKSRRTVLGWRGDKPNGEPAKNVAKSIEAFNAALTVLSQEKTPERWARVQQDLAMASLKSSDGNREENLDKAIVRGFCTRCVFIRRFPATRWNGRTPSFHWSYAWMDRQTGDRNREFRQCVGGL